MAHREPQPDSSGPFLWNRVGTFFRGAEYKHFDWDRLDLLEGGTIAQLGLSLAQIDAACVNPLDWDHVWFFYQDEVADYRADERKTTHQRKIAAHPVFRVLPPEFHAGVTAVITGDPYVDRGEVYQRMLMVVKGDRGCVLTLDALDRATLTVPHWQPSWVDRDDPLRGCANGAGQKSGSVYAFGTRKYSIQSMYVPADQSESVPPPQTKNLDSWCRDFPKAALPIRLTPAPTPVAGGTPNATAVISTRKFDDPPDTLPVITVARTAGLSDLDVFLNSLPQAKHSEKDLERRKQIDEREVEIVNRITKSGDIPDFMRTFHAVKIVSAGYTVVFYAMPDYLAVGTDARFVRFPLSGPGGQEVANRFGCILPTEKMVQAIWDSPRTARAPYLHLPLDKYDGPVSTRFVIQHNATVETLRKQEGITALGLLCGPKKELTINQKAMHNPLQPVEPHHLTGVMTANGYPMLFYGGWMRPGLKPGVFEKRPKQGAGGTSDAAHHSNHFEYAVGVRLIHHTLYYRKGHSIWKTITVRDALKDPDFYKLISVERIESPSYPKRKDGPWK